MFWKRERIVDRKIGSDDYERLGGDNSCAFRVSLKHSNYSHNKVGKWKRGHNLFDGAI